MTTLNVEDLPVSKFEVTSENKELNSIFLANKTYKCMVTKLKNYYSITVTQKTDNVLPISYSRRRNQFYVDTDGFSVKNVDQLEAISAWILYSLRVIDGLKEKLQELGILKNS